MPSPLAQVVYTSKATSVMTRAQLEAIAEQSSINNGRAGVTGLLVYGSGHFMQVLEGDVFTVHALFERISADFRHGDVTRLFFGPLASRRFPRWSMRLLNLEGPCGVDDEVRLGLSEVIRRCESMENPGDAIALLRLFRDLVTHARAA